VPAGERRRRHAQRARDGLQVFPAQQPKHRCSLALSGHPATAAERRYVRLSRSLRVTRPRSNDVRLIVHGTPLVRKSSACEVSQSTVMRRTTRLRWASLVKLGTALPAIVLLRNGSAMVVLRIHVETQGRPPIVVLQDPNAPQHAPLMLDEVRFTEGWDGEIILVKRDYHLRDEDQPFGFRFVVAQLLRDRRVVRDLGICAVILSITAISPIMFWRVLVDRVMYYGSLDTFTMICIAFAVILLFETAFGHLRRYLVLF